MRSTPTKSKAGFAQKWRYTHREAVALTKASSFWQPIRAPLFLLVSGLILQFLWEGRWEEPMGELKVNLLYHLIPIALYFIGYYVINLVRALAFLDYSKIPTDSQELSILPRGKVVSAKPPMPKVGSYESKMPPDSIVTVERKQTGSHSYREVVSALTENPLPSDFRETEQQISETPIVVGVHKIEAVALDLERLNARWMQSRSTGIVNVRMEMHWRNNNNFRLKYTARRVQVQIQSQHENMREVTGEVAPGNRMIFYCPELKNINREGNPVEGGIEYVLLLENMQNGQESTSSRGLTFEIWRDSKEVNFMWKP